MPQIRKRAAGQYQAIVRLVASPPASRTFPTRAEAVAWGTSVEKLSKLGHGESFKTANRMTLHDALQRYGKEVTPMKKSVQRSTENPMAPEILGLLPQDLDSVHLWAVRRQVIQVQPFLGPLTTLSFDRIALVDCGIVDDDQARHLEQ
jgi:hypothetical protein